MAIRVRLFFWIEGHKFQSWIAKNDPIKTDTVVATGRCQGQKTILVASGNQNTEHAARWVDLPALKPRLTIHQYPDIGTRFGQLSVPTLPAAARNRSGL